MDTKTQALGYYATPGPMTDPGCHADLLDGLPAGIPELSRVVQGVLTHPPDAELYGPYATEERRCEIRTHSVEGMLDRIRKLDDRPLSEPRSRERCPAGICAHAATLMCSLLRHQDVPARVRDGFAAYLAPGMWTNHWVTEYWDSDRGTWVRADAELPEGAGGERGLAFDPADVPEDQFIPAGEAWRRCRAGEADPASFGYPGFTGGLGYIAQQVVLDLAALNKVELLPEDRWGILGKPAAELTGNDLALFDRVAALTTSNDVRPSEVREVYEGDDRLRVPPVVYFHHGHGASAYPIRLIRATS
jgi:hypothetical protein